MDEAHHTVAATYKTVLQGLGMIEELTPKQGNTPVQSEQQDSTTASSSSSTDDDVDSESSVDDSSTPGVKQHVPLVRVLPNPHQLLLGFTATPYRLKTSESRHLYDIFSTTYACNIADMIRQGYLAQVGCRLATGPQCHPGCMQLSQKLGIEVSTSTAPLGAQASTVQLCWGHYQVVALVPWLEHCSKQRASTCNSCICNCSGTPRYAGLQHWTVLAAMLCSLLLLWACPAGQQSEDPDPD